MKLLTAFYDLSFGPVSFDFVTWLVRAMLERQRAAAERLHVVVVPKEDGLGGFARHWGKHDEAATLWRLWHILLPAAALGGATLTVAPSVAFARQIEHACRSGREAIAWWPEGKAHFMGPLVDAAHAGEEIPKLQATDQALRYVDAALRDNDRITAGRPLVTLTLRSQTTDPDRNTNPEAWEAFGQWLLERGYEVVELNDSNQALSEGRGFAELDVDLRLALYERAVMNVIGNNGPQELLKFSAAPYRAMGQAPTPGWQDHFRKFFHLGPGEQLPWAGPEQRLVYKPDTFENLQAAFA